MKKIRMGALVFLGVIAFGLVFVMNAVREFELQVMEDADRVYDLAKATYAGEVDQGYIADARQWAWENPVGHESEVVNSYVSITPKMESEDEKLSLALFKCYIAKNCGKSLGSVDWDTAVRTFRGGPRSSDEWYSDTDVYWWQALRSIIMGKV